MEHPATRTLVPLEQVRREGQRIIEHGSHTILEVLEIFDGHIYLCEQIVSIESKVLAFWRVFVAGGWPPLGRKCGGTRAVFQFVPRGRQRAAQLRGLGSARVGLHGRVVMRRSVVEMARTVGRNTVVDRRGDGRSWRPRRGHSGQQGGTVGSPSVYGALNEPGAT